MATAVVEQPKAEHPPDASRALMERRHRITVEEYHRMLDSGAFGPEPRVELRPRDRAVPGEGDPAVIPQPGTAPGGAEEDSR